MKFNFSNLSTAIILLLLAFITFNPSAKAKLIEGLMMVGLFQPTIVNNPERSEVAPDLSFIDEQNKQIKLSDLRGKVVFLNFWATWCPPCIAEIPSINRMSNYLKDNGDFIVLMVDVDGNLIQSQQFLAKRNVELSPVKINKAIPEGFISNTIPTTLVLDKAGRVVFRQEGGADYSSKKFTGLLNQLLAE
jgi:thiol-disulfide isomerase/thioredoxin